MKAAAKTYRGIEFVGVGELAAQQQSALQANTSIERIKILIDGKIVSNCIQYAHYVKWYADTFEKPAPVTPALRQEVVRERLVVQQG